jgi:hypothetical protein
MEPVDPGGDVIAGSLQLVEVSWPSDSARLVDGAVQVVGQISQLH